MTRRAWYLNVTADRLSDRAILVGDPGRVDLFAELLESPELLGSDRALRTLTGTYRGRSVTICSFGMGAPVAAVVLEELAWLGVRVVLRAGTVMTVGQLPLGDLVLASGALRGESTSAAYAAGDALARPDPHLLRHTAEVLERRRESFRLGRLASYDGFYTELMALRPEVEQRVGERLSALRADGVVATDMETSAVLAVSRALGMRGGSLCLASVDGPDHRRLEGHQRRDAELRLAAASVESIATFSMENP